MSSSTVEAISQQAINTVGAVGSAIGETLGFFETSGTVFVTSATGVIGYRVANRLLDAGHPTVRVGARDPKKVQELNKRGAEIADFCWENEDTYDKALHGVKSVFCSTPYTKGWARKFPQFLKACRKAGVRNFVKVSFYHARKVKEIFQNVPFVALHGMCDEYLSESGIPYTIVAASHFMSNPLVFQGKELMSNFKPAPYYGASQNHGVNYVSPNDVAEVATRVILAPKTHHGMEYTITGPEAIPEQEVASILSKHLSKPIMYCEQPIHYFEDTEKMSGHPIWMVRDIVALEQLKASGKEELKSFKKSDFEVLCDHQPETFDEYLRKKDCMSPLEKIEKACAA